MGALANVTDSLGACAQCLDEQLHVFFAVRCGQHHTQPRASSRNCWKHRKIREKSGFCQVTRTVLRFLLFRSDFNEAHRAPRAVAQANSGKLIE